MGGGVSESGHVALFGLLPRFASDPPTDPKYSLDGGEHKIKSGNIRDHRCLPPHLSVGLCCKYFLLDIDFLLILVHLGESTLSM